MAIIATDTLRLSSWLKQEYNPDFAYCRSLVVVNDTAGTLATGTVLGKVTSGGKFKRALETAVDGSKVAAGIVITPVTILGATDTTVLVLSRGPASVGDTAMVVDATYNDSTKLGVLYADLEAKGIQVLKSV